MNFIRDHTMYAAIFGFFAFVWFGWAQENPRPEWRWWLAILSIVALGIAIWGGILSVYHWHDASALSEGKNFVWYLIFFYAELLFAVIGVILLVYLKQMSWTVVWVSAVVAIHFIALAFVFQDSGLFILAAAMLLITLLAHPIATYFQVANSAITGIGNGSLLIIFAVRGLILFFQAG
ncbi:MAG: hypothetical protein ABF661_04235 [Oenococcus sp.]|uniref:hypothetical protein n=1 Tax=Oenococcus sp. TaxID=1979414 RepID=UPI0039EC4762